MNFDSHGVAGATIIQIKINFTEGFKKMYVIWKTVTLLDK